PSTFRARADRVEVDGGGVDKSGAPVRGLTAADFELRDRGKAQTIATFDEMSHDLVDAPTGPPPGLRRDVSSNQTAQSSRLVVLVVDDLHIYRERTDRAREIARKAIADLGPQSSMAGRVTSGEPSTAVAGDPSGLGGRGGRHAERTPVVAPAASGGRRPERRPARSGNERRADPGAGRSVAVHEPAGLLRQHDPIQDAAGRGAAARRR